MRSFFILTITSCVFFCGRQLLYSRSLDEDLKALTAMRKGRLTELTKLNHRGEALLRIYSAPKDRGRIYYELAHAHAQSGVTQPDRLLEYAQKALECPLDPERRAKMYVYSGDALQVRGRRDPLPEMRKSAVLIYLKGLSELLKYNIPDPPLEIPLVSKFDITPANGPLYEAAKRKHDQQWEALQQVKFQNKMLMHRDVLQGQIVSLYVRRPHATAELKIKATNVLGEGKELDRLMTALQEKIAKLPPEAKQTMTPVEAVAPPPSSKHPYLFLIIGAGALISAILLLLSRWRGKRQEPGPS